MDTDELSWEEFTELVTWTDLFSEIDDTHVRLLRYIETHQELDVVPGAVGMVMCGCIASYPALRAAMLDSAGATTRPPRAVVEMILSLSRQARQLVP